MFHTTGLYVFALVLNVHACINANIPWPHRSVCINAGLLEPSTELPCDRTHREAQGCLCAPGRGSRKWFILQPFYDFVWFMLFKSIWLCVCALSGRWSMYLCWISAPNLYHYMLDVDAIHCFLVLLYIIQTTKIKFLTILFSTTFCVLKPRKQRNNSWCKNTSFPHCLL